MLPPPRELTLRLPGLRLAAKAWGNESGSKLLALHGWLDNAGSFDALLPHLSGVHVVALDLPGHGLSEHRHASASYELLSWIPDVVRAADALGWKKYSILGHSLGAAIATIVAAAVPDEVEKLVLLDALGPLTADPSSLPRSLIAGIVDRRRPVARQPPVYADFEVAVERLLQAIPGLTLAAAHILLHRGTRHLDNGVTWSADSRLRHRSLARLTEQQVQAILAAIRCPTLVIRAHSGWPIDADVLRQRLDCVSNVALVEVEGQHHVHLVHPQRVWPAVQAFLDKQGPSIEPAPQSSV